MDTTEEDFPGSESIDPRDNDTRVSTDFPGPDASEAELFDAELAERGEISPGPEPLSGLTATYSPEDNKLRLYSVTRLDKELYIRVKTAGFKWAPKQELFVAPMWTPARADLLIELCGEIGDEDTSLVDRQQERAERFEDYSEKRAADAESAHKVVEHITSGIPLGQPILVGHHSEKRARRDAERIESSMRKVVKLWDTSKYWVARAKGAIRHAKYKEIPAVRYRRIKGLEADKRKQEKTIATAESYIKLWAREELTMEQATQIANFDHGWEANGGSLWSMLDKKEITAAEAAERATRRHNASINYARRWLDHIDNRLAYERAMLDESGGIAVDKIKSETGLDIEVGGRVLCKSWRRHKGYLVVLRVTKKDGAITSVRTAGEGAVSIEDIEDYKAPEAGDAEKVKKATKLPPLVNYPGEGFRHMLKADYDKVAKRSDMYSVRRVAATEQHGAHRRREAPKEGRPYYDTTGVYLTDVKRVDPPAPEKKEPVDFGHVPAPVSEPRPVRAAPERTKFDDVKDALKGGVQVVSAHQLFPTPYELCQRMVKLADVQPGMCVLEPSAGTGNIVRAVLEAVDTEVLAYEINQSLCSQLQRSFPSYKLQVRCKDFLAVEEFKGCYPRILMNSPFEKGVDVDHVTHAWGMLAPGGILVAIMSAGTKYRNDKKTEAFRALVDEHGEIEDLPDDTFKAQGTSVRTVLVTLRK